MAVKRSNILFVSLFIILGLILSVIPYSWIGTWSGVVFNALHFPAFAVLGAFIRGGEVSCSKLKLVFCASLPILIEIIQLLVGRSFDLIDLAWGYMGLVLGIYYARLPNYLLALLVLVYVGWVVSIGFQVAAPYLRLPLISDFETERDFWFVQSIGNRKNENLTYNQASEGGGRSLLIGPGSNRWSGLYIEYNWLLDLTPFKGLVFDIKNPNQPIEIDIKLEHISDTKIYSVNASQGDWQTYTILFDEKQDDFHWNDLHAISIYTETRLLKQPLEIDEIRFLLAR